MTTTIRTAARSVTAPVRGVRLADLLNWLIEADRRHRETRHVRRLPDHLLQDTGMTRTEARTLYAPRLR